MFALSYNLSYVDMSSFDTLNCSKFDQMFEQCIGLTVALRPDHCLNLFSAIPSYVSVHNVTDF